MTVVICIAVIIAALLSMTFFHCNAFFCLVAAAAAAVICVLKFLFKKFKLIGAVLSLSAFVLVICCCYIPSAKTSYGFYDYTAKYGAYLKALDTAKDEKIEKAYTELSEKYGETDEMRYMEALKYIAKGETEEAESVAGSFENKSDMKYFLLRESLVAAKYSGREDADEDYIRELRYVYESALDVYPDWFYPNKKMGIILFRNSEFAKADFYLTKAIAYAPEPDGEMYFFLGASLAERGLYEKSYECFDKALNYELDEKYEKNIAAYLQKSGWEASENES